MNRAIVYTASLSQLSEVVTQLHHSLKPVSATPLLDAQVLAAFVLERPRAWVLAHPEFAVSPSQESALEGCLERLLSGEPLPYVLGRWEFYGLELRVSHDTHIPRPETELLVETALAWLKENPGDRLAADIGTGCGGIALSLAVNRPNIRLAASDISYAALQIAKFNARVHNCSRKLFFLQCDLIPPVKVKFDLICANLPYIPAGRLGSLKVTRWEPLLSLDGGYDGLEHINRLLWQSQGLLSDRAAFLIEIDVSNAAEAAKFARQIYPQAQVQILQDLSGRDRLLSLYFK